LFYSEFLISFASPDPYAAYCKMFGKTNLKLINNILFRIYKDRTGDTTVPLGPSPPPPPPKSGNKKFVIKYWKQSFEFLPHSKKIFLVGVENCKEQFEK